jgi:hypothetical protein
MTIHFHPNECFIEKGLMKEICLIDNPGEKLMIRYGTHSQGIFTVFVLVKINKWDILQIYYGF